MHPIEDEKAGIGRFLCGAVPWSGATDTEMKAEDTACCLYNDILQDNTGNTFQSCMVML
ncbi:MAG: hypothetical protein LBT14_08560 [Treponema sp.]|jgi:hypothetical protein|nr:hypothetical protein [Treponema sp.]